MTEHMLQTTTNRILGDVATVDDQIREDEVAILEFKGRIVSYQDEIKRLKEDITKREQRVRRNRKRKSVFLRAKTELEVIDVEVE